MAGTTSDPEGGNDVETGSRIRGDGGNRESDPEVARILAQAGSDGRVTIDELIPIVYGELRRMAGRALRHERNGHTLNTTALVHEAYVRLAALDRIAWRDRTHFLAMAARTMRRVLIDYAAGRKSQKRDGGERVPLVEVAPGEDAQLEDLLAVDVALERLEQLNPRLVRVVECRYFAGMTIEETAQALDASPATVKRDWSLARAWLSRELASG